MYATVICPINYVCSTGFTPEQFNKALSYAVPIAAGVGAVSLALELVYALWE